MPNYLFKITKLSSKSFLRKLCFILFFVGFQSVAQQIDVVDFLKVEALVTPNPKTKSITGEVKLIFKILKDTDSVFLDAKDMRIVDFDDNKIQITASKQKIWLVKKFKSGKDYSVRFKYEVTPKQTFYFMPDDEMWTQGQGKYTSHWLPSLDDTNDKIEFDLTIVAAKDKTVISNGKLKEVKEESGFKKWKFDMKNPMSSYLVAVAIGDFNKEELVADSGVPLQLYFKPGDLSKVEPTYRYSKQIFDFLEEEIGVAYPWQDYKQVPVRDFLYAGMENTSATFFSEAFLVDSIGFNDRNYINVNAHELAHHWFGNMITAKSDEHHWLQEGFATYYALLAEREIFGDEYFYWQLYQNAEHLKALSDEGKGESLLNPKASSLTFYQKGAWALHVLREYVGEESFKNAIKAYLEKYKYQVVTTEDFLNEISTASELDITSFEKNWLLQSAFKAEEAYQSLMKSSFIKKYFEISALRATPFKDKKNLLEEALIFPDDFIGQEVVYQLANESISETIPLYKKALESNNLYVRQAFALSLEEIPRSLLKEYESLLDDESYVTIEMAMYQLYMQFPEKRLQVLDKTKDVIGFQDKNIRQLWLALALITEKYEDSKKESYLLELRNYSSALYSFEIRQKAFEYINELQIWDQETLKNLIEASVHHNWRFTKMSRNLLLQVIDQPKYLSKIESIKPVLSLKEKEYLNTILK